MRASRSGPLGWASFFSLKLFKTDRPDHKRLATVNERLIMSYSNQCAYCNSLRAQTRGRPSQWCSAGCKSAGQAEIRRVGKLLASFEEGAAVDRLNGVNDIEGRRGRVIADLRARLDTLYGVAR